MVVVRGTRDGLALGLACSCLYFFLYLDLSCLALPCLALPCLALPCLALPYRLTSCVLFPSSFIKRMIEQVKRKSRPTQGRKRVGGNGRVWRKLKKWAEVEEWKVR